MFSRGNVVGGMSIQEVYDGEVSGRESIRGGTVRIPIYQLNFLTRTALKSSKKEQWSAAFVENPEESLFSK